MSRTIPTINTSRLVLRAMRPQDFERYAEIWADEVVVRHVGGKPWDRPRAWSSFLRNAGHWQMTGYGQWAIEPHGAGQMMGQVGFFFGSRALGDDFDRVPEAGWVMHPDAQGHGFGREAAMAAHDWFDRVITGPLVCLLSPENASSRHLAEGLGYRFLRAARLDGDDVALMSRPHPPGRPRNLFEDIQPSV